MEQCCKEHEAPKAEGCCAECPDKGCEGCACSAPANKTGCCMGGGCGCGNR